MSSIIEVLLPAVRFEWVDVPPPLPPAKTTVLVRDGLRSRAQPWFGTRVERAMIEARRAYAGLDGVREVRCRLRDAVAYEAIKAREEVI